MDIEAKAVYPFGTLNPIYAKITVARNATPITLVRSIPFELIIIKDVASH